MRLSLALLLLPLTCGAWSFNWTNRVDWHGKPAGHFATTPFPIWETNTTYTITNDESPNGKTFTLGTLYFVDGAKADDTGSGLSLATAKKTIQAGLDAAGSGNKTVLVRGAHDAFDGLYHESDLNMNPGTDDTHRFMLCGYGQERPVIDGDMGTTDIIRTCNQLYGYWTVQRLQVQNNKRDGIYAGILIYNGEDPDYSIRQDYYANTIDCFVTNCCFTFPVRSGNTAIYYINTQYGWLFHNTVQRSLDHAYKIGDTTSDTTVEWCIAKEAGWWTNMVDELSITNYATQLSATRAVLFDFPTDATLTASNITLRYCIGYDGLYGAVQLRNIKNGWCHHNEFYNSPRFDDVPGRTASDSAAPYAQVQVVGVPVGHDANALDNVHVYSNVIHNSGDTNCCAMGVAQLTDGHTCYFYNNLCYSNGVERGEVWLYGYRTDSQTTRKVYLFNNTLVGQSISATYPQITVNSADWGLDEVFITNNVVIVAGSGKCANFDAQVRHGNNLYYYPNGSLGFSANGTEITERDVLFAYTPSEPFAAGMGALQLASPAVNSGVNLSTVFTDDINSITRTRLWEMGAYDYPVSGEVRIERASVTGKVTLK